MSLVNDMLRDLDRRKQLPEKAQRVSRIINTREEAEKSRFHPLLVAALLVICLLAGMGGGYVLFSSSTAVPAANERTITPAQAVREPVEVSPEAVAEPAGSRELIAENEIRSAEFAPDIRIEQELEDKVPERNEQPAADPARLPIAATEPSGASDAAAQPRNPPEQQPIPAVSSTQADTLQPSGLMGSNSAPASSAPVRINRELTFEQRDRSKSREAIDLVRSGRQQQAYEALIPFLEQNPQAHISRETLATILMAQNELAYARLVVDEGLQLAPNYAAYKKIKARLLMQDGQLAEALELMNKVPPAPARDLEYHELLASLYQQANRHDMAVSTYQELIRINPERGRWWAGLGISLDAQGRKEQAIASYQTALQAGDLDTRLRSHSQDRIRSLSVQ